MRDLILMAALLGLAPMVLRNPFVGVLTWLWISLMNPQREVYSFLADAQLNMIFAVMTIAAWLISRERKVLRPEPFVLLLLLFAAWSTLCTWTALDRSFSLSLWERTMKSVLLVVLIATLANTRERVQAVVWVVAISLGFHAVKGGGFVLLTGGSHRVYGPDNTMIADNNALGLALVVLLPLINHLRSTSRLVITRLACVATMAFTLLAIMGTYSRGAILALCAIGVFYALRARTGILLLAAGVVVATSLPAVAPAGWLARMSTIGSADEDASFQGRVAAWKTSVNIATARPLVGGGFSAVERTPVVQAFQTPGSLQWGKAAHSIYFEVLGDTGFVGLAIYVLLLLTAGLNTLAVLAAARDRPELRWARDLARMLQVSLIALLVGGAALSVAYYDGFLVILALTACLRQAVRAAAAPLPAIAARQPRWKQTPVRAGGRAPVPAARLSFERSVRSDLS